MTSEITIGSALIDRDVLDGLERVWMGGFGPSYLRKAELALRAFIVAPTLVVSRLTGDPYEEADLITDASSAQYIDYQAPFSDHFLDYEFVDPREPHPYQRIPADEESALEALVARRIEEQVQQLFPRWITTIASADAFLNAWYQGQSFHECESAALTARTNLSDSDAHEKLQSSYLHYASPYSGIQTHAVFGDRPVDHARYLVGCHRAGLLVFGASPIAQVCEEHLFIAWPRHLFEILGEDFEQQSRLIAAPNVAFGLPPLLSILLGRAARRTQIPFEISAMREEYASARTELWALLANMWRAESFAKQVKLARALQMAAKSIVPAAFRGRANAIDLAIDVASVNLPGIARQLLEADEPNSRVSAISFARRLSRDLRRHTISHALALRRHLTKSELSSFGLT